MILMQGSGIFVIYNFIIVITCLNQINSFLPILAELIFWVENVEANIEVIYCIEYGENTRVQSGLVF
jgi:hypothetical protein